MQCLRQQRPGSGSAQQQRQQRQRQQRQSAAPPQRRRVAAAAQPQAQQQQLAPLPTDYVQAVRQAQAALKAAIADGVPLIEVEFPTLSLTAAQGDGEGQNEMNASMDYLRKTLVAFQDRADRVRVFFPDQMELVRVLRWWVVVVVAVVMMRRGGREGGACVCA